MFFAGESEDGAVTAGELFAVGQVVVAVTNGLVQAGEKPRGAQVVSVDKVSSTVGILRKELPIRVYGAGGPAARGAAGAEDGEDFVREVVEIIGRRADAATVSVINVAGGAAAIDLRHAILGVETVRVRGVVSHVACAVVLIGRTEETIIGVHRLVKGVARSAGYGLVRTVAPGIDCPGETGAAGGIGR